VEVLVQIHNNIYKNTLKGTIPTRPPWATPHLLTSSHLGWEFAMRSRFGVRVGQSLLPGTWPTGPIGVPGSSNTHPRP
jgi:hypothetical protein